MTSFLLLLWLLHLRHRQQLPGPFDKGAELLWQVPIQKIHHRTDPIQEPIREAALLLQLLFQALHLYQQLSVLVFKPLPLLSLLQLFFCRGDFLLKPLIFFLQLLHFLFRCRTPLYKEASYKPYIIAAMIFLAKVKDPQATLKALEERGIARWFQK